MDQLIFASLSDTHYWYEVGMLRGGVLCFDRAVRTNGIRSGHEARLGVLG